MESTVPGKRPNLLQHKKHGSQIFFSQFTQNSFQSMLLIYMKIFEVPETPEALTLFK